MTVTKFDGRQTIIRDTLTQLAANASGVELDNIARSADSELTMPLRMTRTYPTANLLLNIGAISVTNPEHSRTRTIQPIANTIPTFTGGTVTLSSTGGGSATPSTGFALGLGMSASQFMRIGINLSNTGLFVLTKGTAGASYAASGMPTIINSAYAIGYLVVRTDGSNNVQNVLDTDIYQYEGSTFGYPTDSIFGVTDATDPTKLMKFDVAGTTGTTTFLRSSQTTDKTITLPDANDTLVGLGTTDILSHKTLQTTQGAVFVDTASTGANATLDNSTVLYSVIEVTNASLTSIAGIPQGLDGQFLYLLNKTGASLIVRNQSATPTSVKRIITGTGADMIMLNQSTVTLMYDNALTRWMMVGGSGSGGTGGYTRIFLTQ
jgi:hypothetical protein